MIATRAEIELMIRDTWGVAVTCGDEETWGHFVVEPQVDLGDMVIDNVPTLSVPSDVPGLVQDALVEVAGHGDYLVSRRMPGSSAGETVLVLREA